MVFMLREIVSHFAFISCWDILCGGPFTLWLHGWWYWRCVYACSSPRCCIGDTSLLLSGLFYDYWGGEGPIYEYKRVSSSGVVLLCLALGRIAWWSLPLLLLMLENPHLKSESFLGFFVLVVFQSMFHSCCIQGYYGSIEKFWRILSGNGSGKFVQLSETLGFGLNCSSEFWPCLSLLIT